MPGRRTSSFVATLAAVAIALCLGAASAGATTFCVPAFSSACPNSGGNVAVADLEEAMGSNATDGVADQIFLGAGTFSEDNDFEPEPGFSSPESFEPDGTDPLSIFGSGPASTTITSAGNKNVYVVNLSYNNSRTVTLSNLAVRVPASFPDGLGAAVYLFNGDSLKNVNVVSLNAGSDGVDAGGPGNLVFAGTLRAEGAGAALDDGLRVSNENSAMTVDGTTLKGASWPLSVSAATGSLTARRVTEIGTRTYGAIATAGTLAIENSIFAIDDGVGLYASAGTPNTLLKADHVTVVNSGPSDPALEVKKSGSGPGDATLELTNSILRGFASGYEVEGIAGPGIGLATLIARYSNFQGTGTSSGVLDLGSGNIDVDPQLAGDYSLPPGSPSIDAGDPAPGGLDLDFLSEPRPNDGDGNGAAVRDQGAFEYQRPASAGGGGAERPSGSSGGEPDPLGSGSGGDPDTKAPQTTIRKGPGDELATGKAKFVLGSSEGGSRFQCKLDARKVSGCRSPQRYGRLEPGRHTFKAWATDAAGNKDPTPAKRSFRVPGSS
jgi:hypothetical protein